MLTSFRIISFVEGLSYIAILSITLGVLNREFVSVLGMSHGVLFMVYLLLSLLVCNKQKWSLAIWGALFLASLIPFAFILVEFFLRKNHLKTKECNPE